jgi:hypothetical protein
MTPSPTSQTERISSRRALVRCLWAAQDSMVRRRPSGRACALAFCEQGAMEAACALVVAFTYILATLSPLGGDTYHSPDRLAIF